MRAVVAVIFRSLASRILAATGLWLRHQAGFQRRMVRDGNLRRSQLTLVATSTGHNRHRSCLTPDATRTGSNGRGWQLTPGEAAGSHRAPRARAAT